MTPAAGLSTRVSIARPAVPCRRSTNHTPRIITLRRRAQQGEASGGLSPEELEAQAEEFMRQQAAQEGVVPASAPDQVLGSSVVSDDDAAAMRDTVLGALRTLMEERDMTVQEVKLILQIEDPRAKERRSMGIEDESGVSRDELAQAFSELVETGDLPKDRIALKVLAQEMENWPFLDRSVSDSSGTTPQSIRAYEENMAGASPNLVGYREGQAVPPVGRDPNERKEGLGDLVPDWMGYGVLYGISAIPVFITIGAVTVLFLNSLQ